MRFLCTDHCKKKRASDLFFFPSFFFFLAPEEMTQLLGTKRQRDARDLLLPHKKEKRDEDANRESNVERLVAAHLGRDLASLVVRLAAEETIFVVRRRPDAIEIGTETPKDGGGRLFDLETWAVPPGTRKLFVVRELTASGNLHRCWTKEEAHVTARALGFHRTKVSVHMISRPDRDPCPVLPARFRAANEPNPDAEREEAGLACDDCHQTGVLLMRTQDSARCLSCHSQLIPSEEELFFWVLFCGICGHLGSDEDFKFCRGCAEVVGECCGILCHSQSGECECRQCFVAECQECLAPLAQRKGARYTSDDRRQDRPLCSACVEKIVSP